MRGDQRQDSPPTRVHEPHAPNFLWRGPFLKAFAKCGVLTRACEAVNVDRSTVFNARKNDPEFAEAFEDAKQQAIDRIEFEARKRAVEGWEEPVFHNGAIVGTKQKFSDRMAEFFLDRTRYPRSLVVDAGGAVDETARAIANAVRGMMDSVPEVSEGEAAKGEEGNREG